MPLVEPRVTKSLLADWRSRVRMAKPFLKWAGGKRYFLYHFSRQIPEFRGSYFEPFLGSGAVFFRLAARRDGLAQARLGDTNNQLIRCFTSVRDEVDAVVDRLEQLQLAYSAREDKAAFYYEQRDLYNATLPKPDSALFIFLNRTCWNGLFRVNQAGRFNVPFGAPKSDSVTPTPDELLNASAALATASIRATTWENTVALARPGDFVFLDPPYFSELLIDTPTRASKYARRAFSMSSHRELARAVRQLASRGVDFMLTNSAEPEMVRLYEGMDLQVEVIHSPRAINSRAERRGAVAELLVTPKGASYGVVDRNLPWVLGEEVADPVSND